jgi:periplasmic protein TonB
MSTTLPAPAARQAVVVASIAALHVGAFLAVSMGFPVHLDLTRLPTNVIFAMPPPDKTVNVTSPDPVPAGDYELEPVKEPDLVITVAEDRDARGPRVPDTGATESRPGPTAPVEDFRSPALRTGDARLQALIDSCYPAAARRRGQEGRGVARVVVDAAGRASRWSVEQTTGFAELDPAMGCVSRRVQFEPGRRDGQAIEATVLMPIFFRLR